MLVQLLEHDAEETREKNIITSSLTITPSYLLLVLF